MSESGLVNASPVRVCLWSERVIRDIRKVNQGRCEIGNKRADDKSRSRALTVTPIGVKPSKGQGEERWSIDF